MRIILSLVALFLLIGVFYGNPSAWAEVSLVETDKHCYSRSEKITISGYVDQPTTKQVNIIITNRVGAQVFLINAPVSQDNTFASLPFDIDDVVKGRGGIYFINAYIVEISEQESTSFTVEGCSVTSSNPNQLVQAQNFEIITSDEITLTTDKPSYFKGEIIAISGKSTKWFGSNVTIQIRSPTGNVIKAESIPIDLSKNFKTEFQTGNEQFKDSGTYSIRATYGPKPNLAQITFQFDGQEQRTESPDQPAPVESQTKPAPVEPTTQHREDESQNPPTVSSIEFIEQLILTNNLIVIFSIIVIAAGIGIVYLVRSEKAKKLKELRREQEEERNREEQLERERVERERHERERVERERHERERVERERGPTSRPEDRVKSKTVAEVLEELQRKIHEAEYQNKGKPPNGPKKPKVKIPSEEGVSKNTPTDEKTRIKNGKTPHEIFGLSQSATPSEIKNRFRYLAKKYDSSHGALHKTEEEKKELDKIMAKINEAYSKLKS